MAKRWHALLEENKGRLRRSAIEERRNLSCYLDVPLTCSVEVGILNQDIYQYPSDGHLVKFMFIHYIKHQQVTVTLYLVIILFFPLSSVHVCMYVCMYHEMLKNMCFRFRDTWLGKLLNFSKPQFSWPYLRRDNLRTVDSLRILHIGLSWWLNEIAHQQPSGKHSINGTIIFAVSVLLLINTMRFWAPLGQGLFIFLLS